MRRRKHETALADIDLPVFSRPFIQATQPLPVHAAYVLGRKALIHVCLVNQLLRRRHQTFRFPPRHFAHRTHARQITQHAAA